MIAFARNIRLLPVVLIAITCLFALKVLGLVLEGGYTFVGAQLVKDDPVETTGSIENEPPPRMNTPAPIDAGLTFASRADAPASWAQRMFNFPDANGSISSRGRDDITGSAGPKPVEAKSPEVKPPEAKPVEAKPNGTAIPLDSGRLASAAERALLERLQERRQELEARARELDIRENLLKVAEKRLEARVGELKEVEGRAQTAGGKKDEADAQRYKGLVTMYENMKAKDAAKIFDRLDMRVLLEVVTLINPRRMSDILGLMTPEAAERLTVELANRAKPGERSASPGELPKIEGRPSGS